MLGQSNSDPPRATFVFYFLLFYWISEPKVQGATWWLVVGLNKGHQFEPDTCQEKGFFLILDFFLIIIIF
jgi:hypothetical protein